MSVNQLPLPVRQLHFSFIPPDDWDQKLLQVGFRLRGMLGLSLKQGCCFFDARSTPCDGCVKRPHCHYGQSFESLQAVAIEGVGKSGSIPHAWALSFKQSGMRIQATLTLAGMEIAYQLSWQAAVDALEMHLSWQGPTWHEGDFKHRWQGVTPVRLRLNGKSPRSEGDVCKAFTISIVSKMRMLAALHGMQTPETHLPEPTCLHMQWCEASRHAYRHGEQQSMSGWLVDLQWPDDLSEAWKPWLNLAKALGVGRQTSFGLGCFESGN